jgi:hypothetical protein
MTTKNATKNQFLQHLNPVGSRHIFFYHLISYFLLLNLPLPISFSIHAGSYCPAVLHVKPMWNSQDTLLLSLKKYVNTAMQAHEMSGNSSGLGLAIPYRKQQRKKGRLLCC